MLEPLVSIVMPCYNSAPHLRNALISVVRQTYPHFELIIIDDGSSDNIDEIVSEFPAHKLVYLKNEKNRGIAASLNKGMNAAKGEFIARFDADDFMYERRLENQVDFLLERNECDLVGSGADVFGSFETVWRPGFFHHNMINELLLNNPIIHPTIMFRRDLFESGLLRYNEVWNTEEDYELWCRILPKIRMNNLQLSTIRYRIHGTNNQRIPGKLEAKEKAIALFLKNYDIVDQALIKACAEFQCSGYISRENFAVMRAYALRAERERLPRLGWLHDRIVYEKDYALFADYYYSA